MWNKLKAHLNSPSIIPEKGILKAECINEYNVEIWFEENKKVSIYTLDFFPILSAKDTGEALKPLLNKERFSQAVGRYNLTWFDPITGEYNENSIDISPEAVKWLCENYGNAITT